MQTRNPNRTTAVGLAVLSALGRVIPHVPNVTPVGASCLFAGSRISGPLAYLIPLVVMAATDPFAFWGRGYSMETPFIYASFLISVWIGRVLVKRATALRVGSAAFLGSLQFFLISNFPVWLAVSRGSSRMYTPDVAGLLRCYAMALPFWGRTLAGDLFFSAALFGVYELISRRIRTAALPATA